MCQNAIRDSIMTEHRLKKLNEDWTLFNGTLHHDTCPKIDGDKIKGAWSFAEFMMNCSCCGIEIPEAILMIVKLQQLKPRDNRWMRDVEVKRLRYATIYGMGRTKLFGMVRENDPR